MESTLQTPALFAAKITAIAETVVYWIVTALFCLQMSFTAFAQLRLPQVAEAFTHLGFPAYFRVELSWAKFLGVVLLTTCAGAGPCQGVDLCRLRHHTRLGAHRAPFGRRWPGGLGLGGGHRRTLGHFILLMAPSELEPRMKRPVPVESASALIDERIKELGDWRGKTLAKMRKIIHEADPEIVEEWKWMGTPVWSHGGIVCTGETYKQVVKMTFAKGAALKDPSGLFNSSLDGNVRRAIDIHEGDKVDEAAFKDLIRAAVALNLSKKRRER